MSVSLETRVPFLDRGVVEFSCRVPAAMKVRNGEGKWLVRQVLDRHVPLHLVDRPKTDGIPLDEWLRGPLKPRASDLLAPDRLDRQGWFDAGRVGSIWAEHQGGRRNHGSWLWNVLMVQAWSDQWCTSPPYPQRGSDAAPHIDCDAKQRLGRRVPPPAPGEANYLCIWKALGSELMVAIAAVVR